MTDSYYWLIPLAIILVLLAVTVALVRRGVEKIDE